MSGRKLKYNEVKERLKQELALLAPGESLPNRNALSKKHGVARTTLERAISELIGEGYVVSRDGSGTYAASRAPQTEETRGSEMWAVMVSNILYDIYPPIVRSVEDFTNEHGIHLVICNTDNENEKQDEYFRKLMGSGVSGLIVVPATSGAINTDLLDELVRKGVSVVSCVRPLGSYLTPGVYINSFQAGFMAVSHLIERGCRKIAYVSSPLYSAAHDRYQGYLAAHDAHGLTPYADLVAYESEFKQESLGEETAFNLLRAHPEIDGIFAFNDRVAQGVVSAMARLGLTPGKNVKVVGCDNTDICVRMPVQLTSVGFQADELGARCARMLHEIQQGRPPAQKHMVLGTTLHVRETS